jgi:hypothetical protein
VEDVIEAVLDIVKRYRRKRADANARPARFAAGTNRL